jgi:hypothetical protein
MPDQPILTPTPEFSALTTLELRTPRENEQTAEAMQQVFHALPNPPHAWWQFMEHAPTLWLEILNEGQTIYFLLTTPTVLVEYVVSQLMAAYPELLIRRLAHNPLHDFWHDQPRASGALRLAQRSQHPLKTFTDNAELDVLSAVLSAFSKLHDGEQAVLQIMCRKAREHWKYGHGSAAEMVRSAVSPGTSSESAVPHPAVSGKLAEISFETVVRLVTQAPSQERAQILLTSLGASFAALQSEHNALRLEKHTVTPLQHQREVIERTGGFSFLRPQYFSSSELATMFHLPNKQLSTIRNIAWGKNLLGEPPENLPTFGTTAPDARDGVNFVFETEFKNQRHVFGVKQADRRRHMYVIGKSGTGKSTLLANMIINDLKHDQGLAVVDPHGDLVETILDYIPRHRINDVVVFDPADSQSVVKMNLFEGGSVVHRELIASGIVAMFQKMFANSWGPRLEYILRNSLLTLLSTNAKLEDVLRILTDDEFRERMVQQTDDQVLKNFWQNEFNMMENRLRTESISPILNKVGQFVTSPLIRQVVNARTSSFDIEKVMNEGKILLVNFRDHHGTQKRCIVFA